jgi:hypothetical protein
MKRPIEANSVEMRFIVFIVVGYGNAKGVQKNQTLTGCQGLVLQKIRKNKSDLCY